MPRFPGELNSIDAVADNRRLAFAWAEAVVIGALMLSLSVLILMIGAGAASA
jgi:hypothetical protein